MTAGADVGQNLIGDVTADQEQVRDVVEVFLNTGNEDIGYWELLDTQGIENICRSDAMDTRKVSI